MGKPYTKPTITKVEVDSQILRMYTCKGFAEVFWETLQLERKANPKVSQKIVFDMLNEKFFAVFGEFRYSSYDSFQQRLNK
jgi:hypothetical protein